MKKTKNNLRSIKTRAPWGKPSPRGYMTFSNVLSDEDTVDYMVYTQADMIREYFPSSHKINDVTYYKDIYLRDVDEDGKEIFYRRPVPRHAYAFQQVITTKRCMHLTGNDVQFEHLDSVDDEHTNTYRSFREGWAHKSMDNVFGKGVLASLIVADCAIVYYMEDGKACTKVLSYYDGDILYPHFKRDGKTLECFARSFSARDEQGDEIVEYLEVWDENDYTVFRRKGKKYQNPIEKYVVNPILALFNFENYECIQQTAHGFGRVPVAYYRRKDGPCWVYSQDTIENYELAKSQMAQNNEEYGEPALVVCSDEESLFAARDCRGTVKEYHIGPSDKIEMLQAQSAADSYMKQCEDDLKLIYKQSFIVDTPEMKSGDLPAAALKIMYSLAYEIASKEALEYQDFLKQNVELFAHAYGVETGNMFNFAELLEHVRYWIEPYVHENTSSTVADLAMGVQNGFISKQTACERIESIYTRPNEWNQIQKENHEADRAELLDQIKLIKAQKTAQNAAQTE